MRDSADRAQPPADMLVHAVLDADADRCVNQIVQLAGSALVAMAEVASGLSVDAARMRANIDLTGGQIFAEAVQMALAPTLGRDVSHKLVADVCRRAAAEGRHVRDVLAQTEQAKGVLDAQALARLFDPEQYLGSNDAYIDRVLNGRA